MSDSPLTTKKAERTSGPAVRPPRATVTGCGDFAAVRVAAAIRVEDLLLLGGQEGRGRGVRGGAFQTTRKVPSS